MTICSMTRSKVKVTSPRKSEIRPFSKAISSPIYNGAGKWLRMLQLGHNIFSVVFALPCDLWYRGKWSRVVCWTSSLTGSSNTCLCLSDRRGGPSQSSPTFRLLALSHWLERHWVTLSHWLERHWVALSHWLERHWVALSHWLEWHWVTEPMHDTDWRPVSCRAERLSGLECPRDWTQCRSICLTYPSYICPGLSPAALLSPLLAVHGSEGAWDTIF